MAAAETYRKILSALLPAGALGMSLVLGAGPANAAREMPASQDLATPSPVGERLSAIRDAVSQAIGEAAAPPVQAERLAWHNWANFGIGIPGWNNWNNGWRNWRNGWNNWNNWNNGWHNWGNGWRNW